MAKLASLCGRWVVSYSFVSCKSLLNSLLERRAERSLSILRPTTICSMGLQQILGQFDPQHQGMVVVEALCLPPICKNHPVQSLSLASGKGTPPGPTSLSSRPIWTRSAIADGPSIVGALTRSVPLPGSWFHDGARVPTYAAETATAPPPMNGVLQRRAGQPEHP